tara:strand:+ start:284 stop:691 length:408 start_codon:yes stop_codon:yes gene_type:complete
VARAPARAVIAQLAAYGLSPGTIATIFDIDVEKVRKAVEELPVEAAVRDDGDLRTGVRRVAWRVIEETMLMLDEGSPAVKQRMITNLFTKMMTMLEEDSADDLSTLRTDLASLVSEMRVVEVSPEEQPEAEDDSP